MPAAEDATGTNGIAVSRLADALRGLDSDLDDRIGRLQALTARGTDPGAVTGAVEAIAKDLLALDLARRAVLREQSSRDLLTRLGEYDLPPAVERRRRSLDKSPDAPEWESVVALIGDALATRNRRGLFHRLFGQYSPESALADDGPDGGPPRAGPSVPRAARQALLTLLERLTLPEDTRRAADRLRDRLNSALAVDEIADVVTAIATLVTQANREENERLERFLKGLTGRLEHLGEHLLRSREVIGEADADRDTLAEGVRGSLTDMRQNLTTDESLEALRNRLERHMDTISGQLDRFLDAEGRRRDESEQRISGLQEQIERAENEADRLRSNLLQQQMRAQLDPLTQVANREAYAQRIDYEFARWRRSGAPLSLLFADIDRFKAINDQHGHSTGDAILQAVARTLKEALRRTDMVARYGGEEFVVIMPDTARDEAAGVAEKLRVAVNEQDFIFNETRMRVTISFGVAEFVPTDRPDDVIDRADRALYEAKRAGRDRVVVAPAGDPQPERS